MLIGVGELVASVFDSYILERYVRYFGAIVVMDVKADGRAVNTVAVAEHYVFEFPSVCFSADLEISAPIAPSDTAFDKNIVHIAIIPAADALEDYTVVKVAEKTIFYHCAGAVEKIYSVGVEAPTAYYFYVADIKILTGNGFNVVNKGISYRYTVDLNIIAVFKMYGMESYRVLYSLSVSFMILIEDLKEDLFLVFAVVQNAAP